MPSVRTVYARQACTHCRRLKKRCVVDAPTDTSCRNCLRARRPCVRALPAPAYSDHALSAPVLAPIPLPRSSSDQPINPFTLSFDDSMDRESEVAIAFRAGSASSSASVSTSFSDLPMARIHSAGDGEGFTRLREPDPLCCATSVPMSPLRHVPYHTQPHVSAYPSPTPLSLSMSAPLPRPRLLDSPSRNSLCRAHEREHDPERQQLSYVPSPSPSPTQTTLDMDLVMCTHLSATTSAASTPRRAMDHSGIGNGVEEFDWHAVPLTLPSPELQSQSEQHRNHWSSQASAINETHEIADASWASSSLPSFPPLSLSLSLRDTSDKFIDSYFSSLNRGIYFFFNESEFCQRWQQWKINVRHQQHHFQSPDEWPWALALTAALATGARLNNDLEYARHSEVIAITIARTIIEREHETQQQQSLSWLSSLDSQGTAPWLSSGLMLLVYYLSAIDQCELAQQCIALIQALHTACAASMSVSMVRLGEGISELVQCWQKMLHHGFRFPSHSQPTLESVDAATREQQRDPQVWHHYLRVKHQLRDQLNLAVDDSELALQPPPPPAHFADQSVWRDDRVRSDLLRLHAHSIRIVNVCGLPARWTVDRGMLDFRLYADLAWLLHAEASPLLTGHQRVGIYGRQSIYYSLLGTRSLALRAARQCVRSLGTRDGPGMHHPPFALSFLHSLCVIGEHDRTECAEGLLQCGLGVVDKISRCWPSMRRIQIQLESQLLLWNEQQRTLILQHSLDTSRRLLEQSRAELSVDSIVQRAHTEHQTLAAELATNASKGAMIEARIQARHDQPHPMATATATATQPGMMAMEKRFEHTLHKDYDPFRAATAEETSSGCGCTTGCTCSCASGRQGNNPASHSHRPSPETASTRAVQFRCSHGTR